MGKRGECPEEYRPVLAGDTSVNQYRRSVTDILLFRAETNSSLFWGKAKAHLSGKGTPVAVVAGVDGGIGAGAPGGLWHLTLPYRITTPQMFTPISFLIALHLTVLEKVEGFLSL